MARSLHGSLLGSLQQSQCQVTLRSSQGSECLQGSSLCMGTPRSEECAKTASGCACKCRGREHALKWNFTQIPSVYDLGIFSFCFSTHRAPFTHPERKQNGPLVQSSSVMSSTALLCFKLGTLSQRYPEPLGD